MSITFAKYAMDFKVQDIKCKMKVGQNKVQKLPI